MPEKTRSAHDISDECRLCELKLDRLDSSISNGKQWKIIIADNEQRVHDMIGMGLLGYRFEGKQLKFLSAYSNEESLRLIEKHPDTAIMFFNFVMGPGKTGRRVVRYIRKTLKNKFVRIIFRINKAEDVPETRFFEKFDIYDFKDETELTIRKLFATMTSALRAYRDLRIIDNNQRELDRIAGRSAILFETMPFSKFAVTGLSLVLSVVYPNTESSNHLLGSSFMASFRNGHFIIDAGMGRYKGLAGKPVDRFVNASIKRQIDRAVDKGGNHFVDDIYIGNFATPQQSRHILYARFCRSLTSLDKSLIGIVSSNIAAALENKALKREIEETQREVIFTLGELMENRSAETGSHIKRVAELSYLLAIKAGLDPEDAELIKLIAPMHDIGKMCIPDFILFKPDKLTSEELQRIKNHTRIGHAVFKNSSQKILRAAVLAARQHHERWDGKGYPNGLKGEEIHISARIIALVDVFDSLTHKRSYKIAWARQRVISYIQNERGRSFDPGLVDIFIENSDEFFDLMETEFGRI